MKPYIIQFLLILWLIIITFLFGTISNELSNAKNNFLERCTGKQTLSVCKKLWNKELEWDDYQEVKKHE